MSFPHLILTQIEMVTVLCAFGCLQRALQFPADSEAPFQYAAGQLQCVAAPGLCATPSWLALCVLTPLQML